MKYLFLLAHPDDEAVAAGGTIRQLATKGEAGEGQGDRLKEFEKTAAIKAHASQTMSFLPLMKMGLMNHEHFQLVLATKKGKIIINKSGIFKKAME